MPTRHILWLLLSLCMFATLSGQVNAQVPCPANLEIIGANSETETLILHITCVNVDEETGKVMARVQLEATRPFAYHLDFNVINSESSDILWLEQIDFLPLIPDHTIDLGILTFDTGSRLIIEQSKFGQDSTSRLQIGIVNTALFFLAFLEITPSTAADLVDENGNLVIPITALQVASIFPIDDILGLDGFDTFVSLMEALYEDDLTIQSALEVLSVDLFEVIGSVFTGVTREELRQFLRLSTIASIVMSGRRNAQDMLDQFRAYPERVFTEVWYRPLDTAAHDYACEGSIQAIVRPNVLARVTFEPGGTNNVRSEPSTGASIVGQLNPGDEFEIIGEPICADGYRWWSISAPSVVGWTVDGDSSDHWIEPIEIIDAPQMVCPNTQPSRVRIGTPILIIGDSIFSRREPTNSSDGTVVFVAGNRTIIIAGPICAEELTWWRVLYRDGLGESYHWIPETNEGQYRISPNGVPRNLPTLSGLRNPPTQNYVFIDENNNGLLLYSFMGAGDTAILGYLSAGMYYEFIEWDQNRNWVHIRANMTEGWVIGHELASVPQPP